MQHQALASGEWARLSFAEQMGNIGSEVERSIKWRAKGNEKIAQSAFVRSAELLALTIDAACQYPSRLRELTRARECWYDFFAFNNQYRSDAKSWKRYFRNFAVLAQVRKGR